MTQTYATRKEQQSEGPGVNAPASVDYGSNAQQAQGTYGGTACTPWLDAAAMESPGPVAEGFSLLSGSGGCFSSEVDEAVDTAAAPSASLVADIAWLRATSWSFVLGSPGSGNCTRHQQLEISIDPALLSSPGLTSMIAHEVGHALDGKAEYQFDPSMSRQQYIDVNTRIDLAGEAEATIAELEVREEMLALDPTNDPGITGATADEKIAAWGGYRIGVLTRAQLVDAIVQLFATGEQPSTDTGVANYWDFYAASHAAAWDSDHPPTP